MFDNASKFNIFFKYENKYLGRFPYYSKNMAYFELIISSRTNLFLFLNSGLWYVYLRLTIWCQIRSLGIERYIPKLLKEPVYK